MALVEAAQNLLEKARRRAAQDEPERARAFVERALALPYDEWDAIEPGPWGAHMLLFTAFTDDLEDTEPGDSSWLDRIEQLVAETRDQDVVHELRSCLPGLLDFGVTRQEERRLERLAGRFPSNPKPLAGITDHEARIRIILGML